MKKLIIKRENVKELYDTGYIHLYDLQYAPGKHYFNVSRKKPENLTAVKTEEEFRKQIPDAVTLCVIIRKDGRDYLLLFYEYRYPTGRFLLSPPAGLIDKADRDTQDPVFCAASRELFEETGLSFDPGKDFYKMLNPCTFSTPGMSDESNAIALFILNNPDLSSLTDANTEGTELFDGFVLADRQEAVKYLSSGRDKYGNYFSVFTWQDILYFISDLWKDYI